MKNKLLLVFTLLLSCFVQAQETEVDHSKIQEDLNEIINDIANNYVYLKDKQVNLDSLKPYYASQIEKIETEEETVLFFEYLLDEFYDNHIMLRTNRRASYRLFAPIYVAYQNEKLVVVNCWQTQIKELEHELVGAEILTFNGLDFQEAINNFPTRCNDKTNPEVKEWIANKVLAGRYNEPRIITLKGKDDKTFEFDLDQISYHKEEGLLAAHIENNVGIIRIHNTLGNSNLVSDFDRALDSLFSTKGLIIDLRNTLSGGNTYVARGIMSRFIKEAKPYQIHTYTEWSENNPDVERRWMEFVSPRGEQYTKPVVVLVGRWTGSMGEGLAVGFEGMGRGEVVGSEMRRLAGEVYDFGFKHQWYGYKLSTAKLYHVNGTIREEYVPTHYVKQTTNLKDETLEKGMELIHQLTK